MKNVIDFLKNLLTKKSEEVISEIKEKVISEIKGEPEKVEEPVKVEETKEEIVEEKPKKRGRKKKVD